MDLALVDKLAIQNSGVKLLLVADEVLQRQIAKKKDLSLTNNE